MAGVACGTVRQISRLHGDSMDRAVRMAIKSSKMTLHARMWFDTIIGINRRTDEHTATNPTQVTVGAEIVMNIGNNFTKRSLVTHASRAMAG